MNSNLVTLQLPPQLYEKLQNLAAAEQTDLIGVITHLVENAAQKQQWLQDLRDLRQQIQENGGLEIGNSEDEITEHLRQIREEIFEAEYAHLYR